MQSKIQQIFATMKNKILASIPMPAQKQKALENICSCRTPQMGGFIEQCTACGQTAAHFHSCGNRNCPVCQGAQQAKWVDKQLDNTLPVQYFHVVFTLPSELNPLVYSNQSVVYGILFKAASETILEMSADPKHLGAQPGFTSVLHTWGQNLQFHPHLHFIVTGGGISRDKLKFVQSSKKFFLPVKAVSKKFKGKFLYLLKKELESGNLHLSKNDQDLAFEETRQTFFNSLHNKDWVVYTKKPFKTPSHVIRYLGRYTHRVAISDARIISFDLFSEVVSFQWKDYKDKNRKKVMLLNATEFCRRFMLHVLPYGFMKIRHYGLLANRNREQRLSLCRRLLQKSGLTAFPAKQDKDSLATQNVCASCGGLLEVILSTLRRQQICLPLTI